MNCNLLTCFRNKVVKGINYKSATVKEKRLCIFIKSDGIALCTVFGHNTCGNKNAVKDCNIIKIPDT